MKRVSARRGIRFVSRKFAPSCRVSFSTSAAIFMWREPAMTLISAVAAVAATAALCRLILARWRLSRAKHPSLSGHARLSQRLARLMPFYEYGTERFFCADDAPTRIADQRQTGFRRLSRLLQDRAPETLRRSADLESGISELQFVNAYRVPFQYRTYVNEIG